MFRLLTVALVMLTVLFGRPPRAHAAVQYTFYAAPDGGGADCSQTAPCSLTGARDKVRTVNSSMTGDIVVYLRGGTYQLSSAFTLTPRDSGMNGYRVIYRAYPGETPIISGGQAITGWTQAGNVWQANVGAGLQMRQLYVNGARATRAASGAGIPGTVTKTATGYTTTDTALQSWSNPGDIEFVYTGYPNAGSAWTESRCGVAGITGDATFTTIVMDEPCWTNATIVKGGGQRISVPTTIENAYTLLDQPGEWYLDRATGVLSYFPRTGEDMATATVIAPVLETLVSGIGTPSDPIRDIQFRGITFAYATWLDPSAGAGFVEVQANLILQGNSPTYTFAPANIFFHAAHNIRFERNTFTHLGAQGLVFERGSRNNTVIGNVFTDISGTAVRIGTVDNPNAPAELQEIGNTVINNYIHNVAVEYRGGVGLMGGYNANTIFAHNEITNVPYSGISLGWGWGTNSYAQNNEIAYNLIHNHLQVLADGGGIYTLSEQAAADGTQRTRIHDNYIHHQGNEYGSLYPDEGSAAMDWYNNVVANTPRWLHIWTTSINNLSVYDNFSDTSTAITNGTNITYANNYTGGTPWPSTAQAIIRNAGLEPAYQNIKSASPTNVAVNKPARASSEYSSACSAAKANNGSIDVNDSCGGWSSNGVESNPWWQVDLGSLHRLTSVELVTRQNGYDQPETRRDFEIWASSDPSFGSYTVLGSQDSTVLPYQSTWSTTVNDTSPYRYVRVVKTGYFFIAELRVLGVDAAPTNVALDQFAVASSDYDSDYAATQANNGNISGDDGWSPSGADRSPWWQVDLGRPYRLTAIELVTRQGCCDQPETRRNVEIWASNNADMAQGHVVLARVGAEGLPHQATGTFSVSDPTPYRYVAVVKTASEYFFISELRVLGTP
jgi:hypothetical protein